MSRRLRTRNHVGAITAGLLLAAYAAHPALAEQTTQHPAAKPAVAKAAASPIRMANYQHAAWGRISLTLPGPMQPEVVTVPGGIELHFPKGVQVLAPADNLHQVAAIEMRNSPDGPIALIRFACDCVVTPQRAGPLLRLDIKDGPKPAVVAAKPAPAKLASGKETPIKAAPPKAASSKEASGKAAPGKDASDLDKLREALTAKLAMLNGGRPAPPTPTATGAGKTAASADTQPAAPLPPICPPHFDASGWKQQRNFVARLTELRARVAATHESSTAMADLAEFYLFYGLTGEALAVTSEALAGELPAEDPGRLTATGGIARLLKREPLDPASPLLAISADCQAPDAALWRGLVAAATGDTDGIRRNAEAAVTALQLVPEPLLKLIVFRIADAAGDNPASLRNHGWSFAKRGDRTAGGRSRAVHAAGAHCPVDR